MMIKKSGINIQPPARGTQCAVRVRIHEEITNQWYLFVHHG